MKSFKDIIAEARMVATGDYRISASGRKIRRLIKVGDDDYSKAKYVDGDGDNDENDEKAAKMRGESVQLEQIDDVTWYDGSDMLGEAQARYSSSYQFTHKPGDAESEKKLSDLKASVKGTGKRVVLQGRLGKNNPNAHKYSKANWGKPGSASSGAHTHQRIKKADAAHHDVYVYDKADTQYDADTISEAVSVKKQDYSWGKMVTIHHGSDTSYPLHPEHQAAIKKLKDGEHTSFTDETNRKVTAHREGDSVHLSSKGTSKKTTVAHSHFNESVNKSDVPAFLRKKNGDKLTLKDLDKERTQNRSHPETLKKINGTDVKEEAINKYSMEDLHKDAADHLKKSIDKQSDDRIAALKNPPKKKGFFARVGEKQINMVKGAYHGLTKESADNDADDVPFDKPYKKVDKEVTTDKSGAKHTAMSRARHLARMAAQQQQKKANK